MPLVGIAAAVAVTTYYFAFEHARFAREVQSGTAATSSVTLPSFTELAVSTLPAGSTSNARPRHEPSVMRPETLLALAALEHAVQPRRFQNIVRVERGDSVFRMLLKGGVNGAEAQLAALALNRSADDLGGLRPGQVMTLDFGIHDGAQNRFLGLRFDARYDRTIALERQSEDGFAARYIRKEIKATLVRSSGTIEHGLFNAGLQVGLHPEPLVRLIHLLAYEVDFQRDVNRGDRFEVLLELYRDRHGNVIHYGEILYAALLLEDRRIRLYRWDGSDGQAEYFNERGESSKRTLMRTPIDGARLSSGFGLRRHPILGFSKLHRGIDFAAPTGTPIYAAGYGTIEKLGWQPGYGNAIVVRHNTELATLYAHLMSFAAEMTPGRRVPQGEIIGYVGTTGLSTGPHLHYEVHQFGRAIDPLGLKLPARQQLQGPELARFLDRSRAADAAYRGLARSGTRGLVAATHDPTKTCGLEVSDSEAAQQGCD